MFRIPSRFRQYLAGGQFRAQVFRGGAWLGAGTVAAQLFRFVRNILLARLLSPGAFGTMAIIISISSMMDTFTEIGIREAVIQSPNGCRREYLNSALWLSLGRSLISYAIIYSLAPLAAGVYHNPQLGVLAQVALLGVIFRGAMSPQAFVSLKRMDYKHWAMLQYGSSVARTVLTIAMAGMIRSVWALAIGFTAEFAILCMASYVFFPFRLSFKIDTPSVKELLRFSRGVFGLAFLNLIYVRADILVLGRLIPPDRLGVYAIDISLAQVPATFVLNYQAQILMPVFSQLHDQYARTNDILFKGFSAVSLLALPVCIFVTLSGRALLSLMYGPQYALDSWPFLIAIVIAFINIGNAQITTAFYAAGNPQFHRQCLLAMAALMLVLIYPAARFFGTTGAQLSSLLAIVVGYAIQIRKAQSLTGFRLHWSKAWLLQFAGPILVLAIAVLTRIWIAHSAHTTSLLLGFAAALTAFLSSVAFPLGRNRHLWDATAAS
jgi:O-antigen/teichoic acid export membrane protein